MNACNIEVHIEELVLHGFALGAGSRIGDALQNELRELLMERGLPPTWLSCPARIDTAAIPATGLTNPSVAGAQIAGAICRGGAE
jgi:hypothetical protein